MATSTEESILEQIQTDIQGLSLTGITSTNVVIVKVARDRRKDLPGLPGVVIAPLGRKRILAGGTNESNDVEYPILVVTIATTDHDQDTNRDRGFDWHEKIIDKFQDKRITGVTDLPTLVDPGPRFEPGAFSNNLDMGAVTLRVRHRHIRS